VAGFRAQGGAVLESTDIERGSSSFAEDVYDFVQRSNRTRRRSPDPSRRPSVLEVNQIWGQTLVDTRHYTRRSHGKDVTIGSQVGFKWHLLGIDMGWISRGLAYILPFTPPMWSDVQTTWRDDFYVPDDALRDDAHTLFVHHPDAASYTARVQPDWDGFVDLEDGRYTFDELVASGRATARHETIEIPMTEGLRLMVDIEDLVFFAHLVPAGARLTARADDEVDYPFLSLFSLVGFLGLLFAGVMWFSTPQPVVTVLDIDEDYFADIVLTQPPPEPAPDATPEGEGERAKGDEGERGDPTEPPELAPRNAPIARQMLDRQIVQNTAIMNALETMQMLSSTELDDDLASGIHNLRDATGWTPGHGGLGERDGGLGGGGRFDSIGPGMGTHGLGAGELAYGVGLRTAKEEPTLRNIGGEPIVVGALDSALIDAVIKRHMSQIKYCYTRQLNKNPNLGGKLAMKFVIANDGSVSNAQVKSSTLGDSAVDACMIRQFLRMDFPPPKGNGIVVVSYPFLFTRGA